MQENDIENVSKIAAILSQPQCAKLIEAEWRIFTSAN